MTEHEIQQRIILAASRGPVRLWRNNVGALRDERGQLVRYGLGKGSADLIGYRQVLITPEMVGQPFAQFVAVEVKRPGGRTTPEQANFLALVKRAGGCAGIARSVVDAAEILAGGNGWQRQDSEFPAAPIGTPTGSDLEPV